MAGQASPDSAPAPAPEAPKKTPEDITSEKAAAEAKEAKAKLQLIRVTSDDKLGSPNPHQAYALARGANHFEGPLPEAVAERFAMFQKAGSIKVDIIDGDGKATPWTPPEKK